MRRLAEIVSPTERARGLALFGLGLAVRIPLILAYPAVYGGDSVARLARSDELILAYQLPLAQLVVGLARALDPDPALARLVFAVFGAAVPVALWRALREAAGEPASLLAAALFALHPLPLYYSLVPYQESLMLLSLLVAAACLQQGRERPAALWLGLACLCRFEAWIAALAAAVARWRRPWHAVLFLLAPAAWILAWQGLSPAGTYVLDLEARAAWSRLAFLLGKLREYTGPWVLGLATAGIAVAARRGQRALGWAAGYVAAFLIAVVAAGHEFPVGSGRVSERLAHVPALAVCALAGLALAALPARLSGAARTAACLLVAIAVLGQGGAWLRLAHSLVVTANRDPSLVLALDVARLADRELGPGERLSVLGRPVPVEATLDYVRKVEAAGGDAARAREIAQQLVRSSPDADRIAANLARPPGTVREGAGGELLAVFDDAGAGPPAHAPLRARFVAGKRAVTVYRTSTR